MLQAIFMIFYLKKKYSISFKRITIKQSLNEIRNSFTYFVPSIASTLITNIQVLILGLFFNQASVGAYSAADKIMGLFKNINNVINQAIYPKLCSLYSENVKSMFLYIKKIFPYFLTFFLFSGIVLILFSGKIAFFLDPYYHQIIKNNILILSFVPLVVFLHFPFTQFLMASGKSDVLSKIFGIVTSLSALVFYLNILFFNEYNIAISTIMIEFIILILLIVFTNFNIKFSFFDLIKS